MGPDADLLIRPMGFGALTPLQILKRAPGAIGMFESESSVSTSGGAVTSWASLIGSDVLAQAGAAQRPTYGTITANSLRGVTFNMAASQYLADESSAIAAALAGVSYSALVVERAGGSLATRFTWGAASLGNDSVVAEGVTSTNTDHRRRVTSTAAATSNTGGLVRSTTAANVLTTTYDGTALLYNTWINGAASLVNASNTRVAQSGMNVISVGAIYSNSGAAYTSFTGSTVWCVLIALGVWTAAERQALEAAAIKRWAIV
jgi:hypothetical protein